MREVSISPNLNMGANNPLFLIAGPCVIEDEASLLVLGQRIKEITKKLGMPFVFKASFDKANRTSLSSYRGPGLEEGLRLLALAKEELQVPILTDIHEPYQAELAARFVDILQIPAFLCRQTDLLLAAAATTRAINVKKGQFLSPYELERIAEKIMSQANEKILFTERGFSFGYNNLVVDMRSLAIMKDLGFPVVFDATHSVQMPAKEGTSSGGERKFALPLARGACGVGIDGLFLEVHQNPQQALCDGPNMIYLEDLENFLKEVLAIDGARREVQK